MKYREVGRIYKQEKNNDEGVNPIAIVLGILLALYLIGQWGL